MLLIQPGTLILIIAPLSVYANKTDKLCKNSLKKFDDSVTAIFLYLDCPDSGCNVMLIIHGQIYYMRWIDLYGKFIELCKVS